MRSDLQPYKYIRCRKNTRLTLQIQNCGDKQQYI